MTKLEAAIRKEINSALKGTPWKLNGLTIHTQ